MSSTSEDKPSFTNWQCPEITSETRLRIYNCITNKKEFFVPIKGNNVLWYNCLSKLDDNIHIGHIRYCVLVDVMRRVLQDYFGYNIVFCFNINDIYDKIDKSICEENFRNNKPLIDAINKPNIFDDRQSSVEHGKDFYGSHATKECKQTTFDKQLSTKKSSFKNIDNVSAGKNQPKISYKDGRDILPSSSKSSTSRHTTNISDKNHYIEHSRQLEKQLLMHMKSFNILLPTIGTRSSDYVHEIIKFIEKIRQNDCTFEKDSSIYFNTTKFNSQYLFEELKADHIDDFGLLSGGEALTTSKETKNLCNYILWRRSMEDEPIWKVSWGSDGRPESHLPCSIIAGTVLGSTFDIYTTNIVSKFSNDTDQAIQSKISHIDYSSVNYVIHIDSFNSYDSQISKSLRNVVKFGNDPLRGELCMQIRYMIILNSYECSEYNDEKLNQAITYQEFIFHHIRSINEFVKLNENENFKCNPFEKLNNIDSKFMEYINIGKTNIHLAMCDGINFSLIMKHLFDLLSKSFQYLNGEHKVNVHLLRNASDYIVRLLNLLGLSF